MYFDNSVTGRETWKYSYTGEELWAPAADCLKKFTDGEREARNSLADLLRDPNVSQDDQRIKDLRVAIEFNGRQREACKVFAREFNRTPEREFHLSLGDVVYFGLV